MSHYGEAWNWGVRGVEETRIFFQGLGMYVLDTDSIQKGGAPAIIGELRRHIVPDLQVSGDGRTRWVEVKYKSSCNLYQKTRKWQHGIDLDNWYAYREVEKQTGIPGLLAIFQERPGPEAEPDPMLLTAPFADLVGGRIGELRPGERLIFWDVDKFECHHLQAGRVPNLTRLTKIIRPWERKGADGSAPRMDPRQQPPPYDQPGLWSSDDARRDTA
jgi:hypothetical protein